jgi:Ca2+-binding EF-hand superfamily protein
MFFNVTAPIAERFLAAAAACENALVDNTNYKNGSISSVLFQHYQTVKHHLPYEFVDLQEPSVYALFANQTPLQKLEYLFQTYLNQTAALSRADAANLLRAIFTGLATVCAASSMTANNSSAVLLEQNANTKSLPPTKRYKYDTDTNTNCNETATTAASSLSEESTNGDSGEVSQQLEKLVASSVDSLCKFCHDTIVLASFLEWTKGLEWINLLDREHWNYMARSFSSTTTHASVKAPPLPTPASTSNTVISFDFTGAQGPQCCIDISKDNLHALKHLCYCTGLVHCSAAQLCKVLVHMGQSTGDARNIHRNAFQAAMATGLLPPQFANLSRADQDTFTSDMMHIFFLLEHNETPGQANASELAIAMCFYCAGTKSSKLATGFELLDDTRVGYLTEDQLLVYLQSYLMSLVALSFLATNKHHQRNPITLERRTELRAAVETGARWTLSHYFDYVGTSDPSFRKNRFTFESFASWYSLGGYNVAPWLELLDLNKVLSLIAEAPQPPPSPLPYVPPTTRPRDRMSSLRRHYSNRRSLPPDVLFSFPLASRRSLVVLKEDAVYVRDVVDQLHLLTLNPNELWESLSKAVVKRRKPKKDEVAVYVSCTIFTQSMLDICRKHSDDMAELLSNFFYCFDIDQVDSVALDELMGGLTLLCGGKKSMKLSFAFSIFDTRPGMSKKKDVAHTLSGEDLFLFLRSILIVTFSCCRQSLDMSDEVVSRCISDTANMICNDVMRHQWETKQTDRLNFDDFGQWYNDGGFERAPWLELLDLRKWVLVEDYEQLPKQAPGGPIGAGIRSPPKPAVAPKLLRAPPHPTQTDVPPPPPEDSLDASFFDDAGIMPMDSVSTGTWHVFLVCSGRYDFVTFLTKRAIFRNIDGRNGYDANASVIG